MYKYQWHFEQYWSNLISRQRPALPAKTSTSIHKSLLETGNGVVVAIVDSGLELAHEDLTGNIVSGGSLYKLRQSRFPNSGDHGTSVAGIIGAVGWNNLGIRGVAPEVSLKGFNYLGSQTTSNWINAWR